MKTVRSFADWCVENVGIDATRTPEQKAEMTRLGNYVIDLERQRDALLKTLQDAQERLSAVKNKGRGNDFYAAIVQVEQNLRHARASHS